MDGATISTTSFRVNNGAVSGTVSYANRVATFEPSSALSNSTSYTTGISTAVTDLAGNPLSSPKVWSFTTIQETTPPEVNTTSPVNGATNVSISTSIAINFNEPMDSSTITSSNITVSGGVSGTVLYVGGGSNQAVFSPTSSLSYDTLYVVTVTTGVPDAVGNHLASQYNFSFTTQAAPPASNPTFTLSSGSREANSVLVTIESATAGATIYYTDDGSNPSPSSNQYTTPFTLSSSKTIKAMAVKLYVFTFRLWL